ncbi:transglutaminase TgpA family protein [Micromonospora sp. DT233]|uniref:transglutaminase TgpA family protein n=1 Tax=Micromonospora sp. DT233 TaxID=3393432 RepID=UPI003CE8319B
MTATRNLGFVAAAATLLAAAPLSAIFERWTWLIQAAVAVAVVAGVAALARLGRVPLWGQALAMLAGLLFALTWLFPSGGELLALLPTPATFAHFGDLLAASAQDMRSYGVKVPDTDPLLFVTVLGVGAVAVVVDVLTVGLRRPALAGLPMLAIYSVPVAVYVDSVPAVPFVVGAAGYLWLLVTDNVERVRRFGRRFTGDGRDVDVWESSPLAAAGRRLAAVGVVLAVALPLAVPGMTGGLLDTLGSGGGNGPGGGKGTGGNPGRVDLFAALSGQLNQSEVYEMVRVDTDEPAPFYLRYGVADELSPNGFRVGDPSGRAVTRGFPDPTWATAEGVTQKRYRATVKVTENLAMPLLPAYAQPVRVDGLGGSWLYDTDLQVFYSNRDNSRNKQYSFDYVRSTFSPAALRRAPSLPADHPLRVGQTDTPPVPQVDALVGELVKGKSTDYDKVRAIYDYFSSENGFTYTLTTKGGTSGQEIVDFLTNKSGFCQQYAAAMAWLVRAAGIPARVAFGFTNGTGRTDEGYVLTNRNLHAWTEVHFDGVGWVPFDATPAYGVQGSTRSAWAPDTDAPEPTTPDAGSPADADDAETSPEVAGPDRADRDADTGLALGAAGPARQSPVWPWWAAGGLVLLALLALPALRRAMLRRRRGPRTTVAVPATPAGTGVADAGRTVVVGMDPDRARAQAHATWDELLDTLVDYRVRVDRTETPRATAERLVTEVLAEDPAAVAAARLLGRAEERARYARDPLTGEELPPALRSVRGVLAAQSDRRTRFLAAVLPPSVLLRWRRAVGDTSSRVVARAGDARYRLLRWNPRRLLATRAGR